MRTGVIVFAALAGLSSALQAAKPESANLKPSTPWELDYSDDSCRLIRQFGSGEDRVLLILERYEPGDEFYLVVAGKPLQFVQGKEDARLQFGPVFAPYETFYSQGSVGELKPAIMVTTAHLDASGQPDPSSFEPRRRGAGPDGQVTTAAQEGATEWLEITPRRGKGAVRLALGAMSKPLAEMRKCTAELLTHWNIDAEAHRSVSRPVAPVGNPAKWISSSDFPKAALRSGERGLVFFRLDIDAEGKATGCHIQRAAGREEFETAVCQNLKANGKFTPALDANGKPIASYWRRSVRFDYP